MNENLKKRFIGVLIFLTASLIIAPLLFKGSGQKELKFSTIESQKNGNYNLQDSGRYTHSINYIKNLCEKNNFKINISENFDLRLQNKKRVNGNIFLIKI